MTVNPRSLSGLVSTRCWCDRIILVYEGGKNRARRTYVSRFCGRPMRKRVKTFWETEVPYVL